MFVQAIHGTENHFARNIQDKLKNETDKTKEMRERTENEIKMERT